MSYIEKDQAPIDTELDNSGDLTSNEYQLLEHSTELSPSDNSEWSSSEAETSDTEICVKVEMKIADVDDQTTTRVVESVHVCPRLPLRSRSQSPEMTNKEVVDELSMDDNVIDQILSGDKEALSGLLRDPSRDPNGMFNYRGDDRSLADIIIDSGTMEMVHVLLEDDNVDKSDFIYFSCLHGKCDILEALLDHPDIDPNHGESFCSAAKNGHRKIIKMLLSDERINPSFGDNKYAWEDALRHGFHDICKILEDVGVYTDELSSDEFDTLYKIKTSL